MKKYLVYALLSFLSLSAMAQMEGRPPMMGQGAPADGPKGPMPPKKEKVKKEKKKKQVEEEVIEGKVPGLVYVFGCSFEFGDSIIYFTPIEAVDSIAIAKKTKFLPYRSDFSQQFKDQLESKKYNAKNQTSSVFFSEKKKKLQKIYYKMRKKYLSNSDLQLQTLSEAEFKFVHPLDYYTGKNQE